MIDKRDIMEKFTQYQKAINMAPATIEWERVLVGWFLEFLDIEGVKSFGDVDEALMLKYQIHLSQRRTRRGGLYNPRTQNIAISTVRKLYKYFIRNGEAARDPTIGVEMAKTPSVLPRNVLSIEETTRLFSCPGSRRNKAILAVLYSTGVRSAELRHLELNDLNPDNGTILVRKGKGAKDRVVPCGNWAWELLEDYLKNERPYIISYPDETLLFVNKYGALLSKRGLLMIVKRQCRKAGLTKVITPHCMRHAVATHMVDNGCDIRTMQEILGHSSPSTTAIYISVSARRLKDAHRRYHPTERSAGRRCQRVLI